MNNQLDNVEAQTADIALAQDSVIMTIPGMSTFKAGMLLGEICCIHRFYNPNNLLAFAGLDPTICQSSKINASHTRMSKRGSRILRYALVYSAHNVAKNNNTFKAFFDSKISQG